MSDTSNSVAFVRKDTLPPLEPPVTEQGIVKWLRENLFATPMNSVLTVVALVAIYIVLSVIVPWLLNGVWTAPSLSGCREQLDGAAGGCFAVLSDRWNQLMFGFKYPTELYWRPTLAFALFIVAALPVLFFDLPRKLLLLTALFPFVAYWLIWGGSFWVPFVVGAFIAMALFAFNMLQRSGFTAAFFAMMAVLLLGFGNPIGWLFDAIEAIVSLLGADLSVNIVFGADEGSFSAREVFPLFDHSVNFLHSLAPLELQAIPSRDLGGYLLNFMLGVTCVSLSIPIGIALALGRQSSMPIIKWICVVFIEFIRGVPLITLLFVASVMLSYLFPPERTVDLFLRVVIMITMFSSAYIAEVIRGGLAALPKGQYEAADSLGLDYPQAMRLIILPQALKISIPGIVNIAVGLFKDTTLVSVVAMFDLIGMIRGPILASTEWSGTYWELFGFAALLFFVVCYGISQYSQWLERRLATDHR